MSDALGTSGFKFNISLSVLNHLGRNLYRNFTTVLSEAISNAWDADASNVWIVFDRDRSLLSIKDDGVGMNTDQFQNQFLKIGYSKRKDGDRTSPSGRPYIGAKGIGKLALLSCAQRVSIYSKTSSTDYVGGTIDNRGLDEAITNDLVPDDYPLEDLDYGLAAGLMVDHPRGTIIVFENLKDNVRSSEAHLRKLLALSFKFSLLDENFTLWVNGQAVSIEDLSDLAAKTEFLWVINSYNDPFVASIPSLKAEAQRITSELNIAGFVATVEKPRDLKITGTDERATIDLFVNGRLREKNIIRHIPTQRIVENYVYGQIHFDMLDREGVDPFTSSREGIVEDDVLFNQLIEALRKDFLPRIIDEWDKLRLSRNEDGDDENARKSKRDRRARDLYVIAKSEYEIPEGTANHDKVEGWLGDLTPDAEFNISAYVDCFLSENLVRNTYHLKGWQLVLSLQRKATLGRSERRIGSKRRISYLIFEKATIHLAI